MRLKFTFKKTILTGKVWISIFFSVIILVLILLFGYRGLWPKVFDSNSGLNSSKCEYSFTAEKPDDSAIEIANISGHDLGFRTKLNGQKFFRNTVEVMDEIERQNGQNMEEKIFQYIIQNKYHHKPITGQAWLHYPPLFLNSVGFGFCDDFSALFYQLADATGLEARVRGLNNQHVVVEVYDRKWKMFDPDYDVFFTNRSGEVTSVDELADDPSLITAPAKRFSTSTIREGDSYDPYSEKYASLFSRKDKNVLSEWYNLTIDIDKSEFELPPGAKIVFPIVDDLPLMTINNTEASEYKDLKLIFPKDYKGRVENFLVIHSIRGDGRINYNNKEYEINSTALISEINNRDKFNFFFDILEARSEIEVIYLLNPKRFFLLNNNILEVTDVGCDQIDVDLIEY